MNKQTLWWFRFVMIPILAALLYASLVLLSPPEEVNAYYAKEGWWAIPSEIFFAIFFAMVYSETNIILSNFLDKKISWEQKPVWRSVIQFLIAFCLGSLLGYFFVLFFDWLFPSDYPKPPPHQIFIAGFLIALPITLVYLILYLFNRWKKTLLEAEALKRENIEAQYETLKNQLDPHFLFNNLNTLTAIVEENPKQAVDFIQNLSHVYRYVLQNRDKTMVTLAEELKLAKAYIFLLKNRYETYLSIEINIPDAILTKEIPPMTLQLLLENVVKHNVIDNKHPLSIKLFFEETHGYLVMQNSLQKKKIKEESTKIGLQNINNRLRLMGKNDLIIVENTHDFSVSIPLKNQSI
jgi:two-component system, LytTR family, sensor kinase